MSKPRNPIRRYSNGLIILESESFSERGRFFIDRGTLSEATADLHIGKRIVIVPARASDEVVAAWEGHGWTVVRRDPARPIYKMPDVESAIALAKRVCVIANVANLIGVAPALRRLNKPVVGIVRQSQSIPAGLHRMLASFRFLPEAACPLPPACAAERSSV